MIILMQTFGILPVAALVGPFMPNGLFDPFKLNKSTRLWRGVWIIAIIFFLHKFLYLMQTKTLHGLMSNRNKMTERPAKTQISLGIRPVWSASSMCAQWLAKDPSLLQMDSKDSNQTRQMPRLIWVFGGCTCHFVGFVMRWLTWSDITICFIWSGFALPAKVSFWAFCNNPKYSDR